MQLVSSPRLAGVTLAVGAVAIGAIGVGASAASTRSATAAANPPRTVTASRIIALHGTVAPGSRVRSASLGQRVFTDGTHGFALADVAQAQYAAATTDGGRTWRTDGPALHVNAAQAPLVVLNIGVASLRTVFAFGGGQVIDATSTGGAKWYQALFQGLVMAVVRNPSGHLVAFIDASTNSSGSRGVTWQYVSSNGGRTWRYDTTVGGS